MYRSLLITFLILMISPLNCLADDAKGLGEGEAYTNDLATGFAESISVAVENQLNNVAEELGESYEPDHQHGYMSSFDMKGDVARGAAPVPGCKCHAHFELTGVDGQKQFYCRCWPNGKNTAKNCTDAIAYARKIFAGNTLLTETYFNVNGQDVHNGPYVK